MVKVYDDYEELEDAMEEEGNDDWDDDWDDDCDGAVIVVTFESSSKRYHYYTDNLNLEKEDKLLIRQYQNKEVVVTVRGYCTDDSQANKTLNIIRKIDNGEVKRRTNKFKKEKVHMKKAAKAIENTKDAVMEAKDVAVKFQKGSAVIVAIKTALFESNVVPAKVKLLIEAGDGISDLVIGLLLQIAAETFTESEVIQEASRNANFAGAVSVSSEFTMIQDLIEKVVGTAVGSINTKTAKKSVSGADSEAETKATEEE